MGARLFDVAGSAASMAALRPSCAPQAPAVHGTSLTRVEVRFDVASQVIAAGTQDVFVQPIVPLSGPGKGQIGVRVGRLLVYVADRDALASFLEAWREAEALADKAFGPELPAPMFGESQAQKG